MVSLKLLKELYELAYSLPLSHLKLRTQIINSGEAIPPLLAEGFAKKRHPKEAARFYEMAMAESDEVVAHCQKVLILTARFTKIPAAKVKQLQDGYISLSKQLNKLVQTWIKFAQVKTR